MKTISGLVYAFTLALLFVTAVGCKKGRVSEETPKTLQEGLSQMASALATANPATQKIFSERVQTAYRYANYADALAALEQIAADPALTERQKKLTADLINLFKAQQGGAAGGAPAK